MSGFMAILLRIKLEQDLKIITTINKIRTSTEIRTTLKSFNDCLFFNRFKKIKILIIKMDIKIKIFLLFFWKENWIHTICK